MVALIFGIILLAFAVVALLPGCLNWLEYVVFFLKGSLPVVAVILGIVALLIGIADIRDKKEALREELDAMKNNDEQ